MSDSPLLDVLASFIYLEGEPFWILAHHTAGIKSTCGESLEKGWVEFVTFFQLEHIRIHIILLS